MANCPIRGCTSSGPLKQCWECGIRFCKSHLKSCGRRPDHLLCSKCWRVRDEPGKHRSYCEKNYRYRGPLEIEKTIGTGSESVYVWYKPKDFTLAKHQRSKVWDCKIGRCKGAPDYRIISQGALTAFADRPTVPLVFRTENSTNLERVLHAALAYSGRRIMSGGGVEWFRTNPKEVLKLYHAISRIAEFLQPARK